MRTQKQAPSSLTAKPNPGPSVRAAESQLAAPGRCNPTRPECSKMKIWLVDQNPRMRHLSNSSISSWTSPSLSLLPNVQDEPRPWLARAVLLGARIVTAMVVGSGAFLVRRKNVLSHTNSNVNLPPALNISLSCKTRSTVESSETGRRVLLPMPCPPSV